MEGQTGESPLYHKVAGVVITGSEDGAQHTNANLLNVLRFQGFTLPPECCAYWVGKVGKPPAEDAEKRRANQATETMARRSARNLAFCARLLNSHPLGLKPDDGHAALVEGGVTRAGRTRPRCSRESQSERSFEIVSARAGREPLGGRGRNKGP